MRDMLMITNDVTNKLYKKFKETIEIDVSYIIDKQNKDSNKLIKLLRAIDHIYEEYTSIGYSNIEVRISSEFIDLIKDNPIKELSIDLQPFGDVYFLTAYYKPKYSKNMVRIILSRDIPPNEFRVYPYMYGDVNIFSIK